MSILTDRVPRRIPEWLSLQDISRAWNEETGEDTAAFEGAFRAWFKDYLVRNAYGEAVGEGEDARVSARLLEGRQIWREIFESFCEETSLAKPLFWFPEGDRTDAEPRVASSEPVSIAEPEPVDTVELVEPVGKTAKPANRDDGTLFRRRVREGGASFIWIAAGLVIAVVAGLVTLGLEELESPVADADIRTTPSAEMKTAMTAPASVDPALAYPPPVDLAPARTAASATGNAGSVANDPPLAANAGRIATPAPTSVADPAAAQIAAAPPGARQTQPDATPLPETPSVSQALTGPPADPGLVLLLQRELQVAGFDPGPLDGLSGPKFAAAVATYQRARKIRVDGHASIKLLSRLSRDNLDAGRTAAPASNATPAPEFAALPPAKNGQTAARGRTTEQVSKLALQPRVAVRAPAPRGRELVRAIQQRLSDRGYYEGPLDGTLGPKTRHAIQVYQRVQRYQTTGRPSRALYEELEDHALDAQALDLFQKGSYDRAIAVYTRLIRRTPKNADAYFNRGLAHKNLGQTEQALANYEIAIALDPAHRRAYLDRANILYDRGLYGAAVRDYFKVLGLILTFS